MIRAVCLRNIYIGISHTQERAHTLGLSRGQEKPAPPPVWHGGALVPSAPPLELPTVPLPGAEAPRARDRAAQRARLKGGLLRDDLLSDTPGSRR